MGTARLLAGLLLAATVASAAEEPTALRVGTSGDYAPFSRASEAGLDGFDVALARAYAEERGLTLRFVRFAWPELAAELRAGRFDVAMSGVTVRPLRSAAGRFTVPVAESGAVLLARDPGASSLDALDRSDVRIGVNAGGHLERAARERFTRATLVVIPDNAAVLDALASGRVDAAVTDTLEAPSWERSVSGARRLGPFTHDRKAYLVRADRGELAADLDAWLLAREADGTLAELRRGYFEGADVRPVATPLAALVAAMDERLALMPLVAAAKRQAALPISDPQREQRVLDAAVADAKRAAARSGREPPSEEAVRTFTRAQIEAAIDLQMAAVRSPDFAPDPPLPDLEQELRPALLRVGERIARLLLEQDDGMPEAEVLRVCTAGLRSPWLPEPSRRGLCRALWQMLSAGTPS